MGGASAAPVKKNLSSLGLPPATATEKGEPHLGGGERRLQLRTTHVTAAVTCSVRTPMPRMFRSRSCTTT